MCPNTGVQLILQQTEVGLTAERSTVQVVRGDYVTEGPPGPGLPAGGEIGQIVVKSGTGDYVTAWQSFSSPSVPVLADVGKAWIATGVGTGAWTAIPSPHDPVTIGATPNGLSISTQVLSLALASTSATGALSSTDWNTFNGKEAGGTMTAHLSAFAHADIAHTNRTALDSVSGTNTGDTPASGVAGAVQFAKGTGGAFSSDATTFFWDNTNKSLGVGAAIDFIPGVADPAFKEGRVYYDNANKTLSVYSDIANTSLQVGQEQLIRVVNKTGAPLVDGTVVYVNGAQGNRPTVGLADADNTTSEHTIGVITADIANNAEGYVTIQGVVRGMNTSEFTAGDDIYVSRTAGQFTNVKPTAPAHVIRVGYALNSTVNGSILVSIECPSVPSGLTLKEREVTSTPTVSDDDHTIWCDATSAAFTASLPTAAAGNKGRILVYKKIDSSVNAVVVGTADGVTVTLTSQNQSVRVQSTGTVWRIIA